MSPAGRGRPAPSPSAVITAPCEKPPSTVRSGGMPASSARSSSQLGASAKVSGNVADPGSRSLDRVPVRAAGRQVEWPARGDAEHSPFGVEQVEQREEVALVGSAAVEEDEQPFWVASRRSCQVAERVCGHVPRDGT